MICYTYYTLSPYFVNKKIPEKARGFLLVILFKQALVKLYIVKRGFFPAVVAFHGTLFKLFKALFVVIIKGKAAIDGPFMSPAL